MDIGEDIRDCLGGEVRIFAENALQMTSEICRGQIDPSIEFRAGHTKN